MGFLSSHNQKPRFQLCGQGSLDFPQGWAAPPHSLALVGCSAVNEEAKNIRTDIQQHTREVQQANLRLLDDYVDNRRSTLANFERMDPHSQQTKDARALLKKAISDRNAYASLIAEPNEAETDRSE
jgi:hypothetical protein